MLIVYLRKCRELPNSATAPPRAESDEGGYHEINEAEQIYYTLPPDEGFGSITREETTQYEATERLSNMICYTFDNKTRVAICRRNSLPYDHVAPIRFNEDLEMRTIVDRGMKTPPTKALTVRTQSLDLANFSNAKTSSGNANNRSRRQSL